MQIGSILQLTFRELWTNRIVLSLFIVSTLSWILMLFALNLDIVEGSIVGLRIFGITTNPTERIKDPETGEMIRQALTLDHFVIQIEAFVAGATYWLGTLLALFATAPLLTGMIESGRIDLLLSKPLQRTPLLLGHILAVWLTMFILATYLLGMIWLVISLKTGVWQSHFFLSILLVGSMFMVMYGIVVLLTVTSESTSVALITTYGLIFASVILVAKDQLVPQINPPWRQVFLFFYHVLPKFAEVTGTVAKLAGGMPVSTWYPVFSSLGFGVLAYTGAFLWFNRRDF